MIIPSKNDESQRSNPQYQRVSLEHHKELKRNFDHQEQDFDVLFNATVNQITFHTYLIRRLDSMKTLCELLRAVDGQLSMKHVQVHFFKHELVERCLFALMASSSIKPLDELLHRFFTYEFLDDTLFYKEIVELCAFVLQILKGQEDQEPLVFTSYELQAHPTESLAFINAHAKELQVRYITTKYKELAQVIALLQRYWYVPVMSGLGFYIYLGNTRCRA